MTGPPSRAALVSYEAPPWTVTDDDRRQRAKQYCPYTMCRRASNNNRLAVQTDAQFQFNCTTISLRPISYNEIQHIIIMLAASRGNHLSVCPVFFLNLIERVAHTQRSQPIFNNNNNDE